MSSEIALISVDNKTGVNTFAEGLVAAGYALAATGGSRQKIASTTEVSYDFGQVLSLYGESYGQLATEPEAGSVDTGAAREEQATLLGAAMVGRRKPAPELSLGIGLVCVNLRAKDQIAGSSSADHFDMGGSALLQAGVKSNKIVVSNHRQYPRVLEWLEQGKPQEAVFMTQLQRAARIAVARNMATHLPHTNQFIPHRHR